jgi:hypothetical protein
LVALSSFCLGLLMRGAPLRAAVTCICLGMAGCAWKRRGWVWPAIRRPRPGAPQAIALALAAAGVGFVSWLSLYRESLDWDGLFNWESKAEIAFRNGGAIPIQYYTCHYDFFHPGYPPLVPLLESWIYGWLGCIDQSAIKLIGPYFYLAAALLVLSAGRRRNRWRWSGALTLIPFLLVPSLALGGGSASSGYADFPLAAVYVCAVAHCLEYWQTRSFESALLLGLSAALLPFTKADGIVPLFCLAAALAPLAVNQRNWKPVAWAILPGLGTCLGWSAFLGILGVPREPDFTRFTPAEFLWNTGRARPLLTWTLQELLALPRWSLLWPVVVAVFPALVLSGRKSRWYPWAATVCLPLLLYPCVYFFSTWNSLEMHVASSLPRLLVQIAPAAALMVGIAFAEAMAPAGSSGAPGDPGPPAGETQWRA